MIKVFIVTLLMGLNNGDVVATSLSAKSCREADVKAAVTENMPSIVEIVSRGNGLEGVKIRCKVISAHPVGTGV